MIGNYTDIGSAQTLSFGQQRNFIRAANPFASRSVTRTLFHARAVFRLARRRRSIALGMAALALGTVVTTAGAAGSLLVHHVEVEAKMQPQLLAPAPPPPPAPAALTPAKHHRFLPSFHVNPLHGLASWYGDVWNGRKTASGETFDDEKLTAAHKTLPLGTIVRVTNLTSHRSVVVKINDRGTLAPNRIIDLSSAAARELGMVEQGLANVKLEILGKA